MEESRNLATFAAGPSNKDKIMELSEKQFALRHVKEKSEAAQELVQRIESGLSHIGDLLGVEKREEDQTRYDESTLTLSEYPHLIGIPPLYQHSFYRSTHSNTRVDAPLILLSTHLYFNTPSNTPCSPSFPLFPITSLTPSPSVPWVTCCETSRQLWTPC